MYGDMVGRTYTDLLILIARLRQSVSCASPIESTKLEKYTYLRTTEITATQPESSIDIGHWTICNSPHLSNREISHVVHRTKEVKLMVSRYLNESSRRPRSTTALLSISCRWSQADMMDSSPSQRLTRVQNREEGIHINCSKCIWLVLRERGWIWKGTLPWPNIRSIAAP